MIQALIRFFDKKMEFEDHQVPMLALQPAYGVLLGEPLLLWRLSSRHAIAHRCTLERLSPSVFTQFLL